MADNDNGGDPDPLDIAIAIVLEFYNKHGPIALPSLAGAATFVAGKEGHAAAFEKTLEMNLTIIRGYLPPKG